MRCPFCGTDDTKVVDSRLSNEGYMVRRRRECQGCAERFTTFESAELVMPRVIKNDGRREPFDEAKMRSGMQVALEKRPVKTEDVEAAVNHVKRHLLELGEREVPSRTIGELVMNELRALDQVAFVRFASVYRSFEDVQAFRKELDRLEREPHPDAKKQQLPLLPDEPPKRKK
jgi:transcriptional repressor NrdR